MKKILFLISFILLGLVGCSDDEAGVVEEDVMEDAMEFETGDPTSSNPEVRIVGKWVECSEINVSMGISYTFTSNGKVTCQYHKDGKVIKSTGTFKFIEGGAYDELADEITGEILIDIDTPDPWIGKLLGKLGKWYVLSQDKLVLCSIVPPGAISIVDSNLYLERQ